MSKVLVTTLMIVLGVGTSSWIAPAAADVIVDRSPDTAMADEVQPPSTPPTLWCWVNRDTAQILGDDFTLTAAVVVGGGSVYSGLYWGDVGDPVRVMIFPDIGGTPSTEPVIDVFTTVCAVDTASTTSQPTLTRKFAPFPPEVLPAGTYWFTMHGIGVEICANTATLADGFGDGRTQVGNYISPGVPVDDLSRGSFPIGDLLFMLHGPEDSDCDGIPDEVDCEPLSDFAETVVIDGCDSGVANTFFDDGCTIADLLRHCAEDATTHGQFVSCVAQLLTGLVQDGVMTAQQRSVIVTCAAQSDLP